MHDCVGPDIIDSGSEVTPKGSSDTSIAGGEERGRQAGECVLYISQVEMYVARSRG